MSRYDLSDFYDQPNQWHDHHSPNPANRHSGQAGTRPPHNGGQRPSAEQGRAGRSDAGQPRNGSDSNDPQQRSQDYHSVHVYAKGSAICFSADRTVGEEYTVRMEGAGAVGARKYEWTRKIAVQFTTKELPFILAVFLGWIPSVQYGQHGAANDKGFSLERQDQGKVFAKVWQKDKGNRAVPIVIQDQYPIIELIMKQMKLNSPHLTSDTILTIARAVTHNGSRS